MLEKTGVPTDEQVRGVTPGKERLQKGPVAVVECFQSIPCDPCRHACRQEAIEEFKDINDIPLINHEVCNGCGVCISQCPGLAIFVLDATYSDTEGLVKMPYEFLPLPEPGEELTGLDFAGTPVCPARVVRVQNSGAQDRTPVVWLAVPQDCLTRVRSFRKKEGA